MVHIANGAHFLIYSSDWGQIPDDATMVSKGALNVMAEGSEVDRALDAGPGWARMTDFRGRDVLAGYSPIASLGWVIIAPLDIARGQREARAEIAG